MTGSSGGFASSFGASFSSMVMGNLLKKWWTFNKKNGGKWWTFKKCLKHLETYWNHHVPLCSVQCRRQIQLKANQIEFEQVMADRRFFALHNANLKEYPSNYTLSPIIMVQWKMGVSAIGSLPCPFSSHFPLKHHYGRVRVEIRRKEQHFTLFRPVLLLLCLLDIFLVHLHLCQVGHLDKG